MRFLIAIVVAFCCLAADAQTIPAAQWYPVNGPGVSLKNVYSVAPVGVGVADTFYSLSGKNAAYIKAHPGNPYWFVDVNFAEAGPHTLTLTAWKQAGKMADPYYQGIRINVGATIIPMDPAASVAEIADASLSAVPQAYTFTFNVAAPGVQRVFFGLQTPGVPSAVYGGGGTYFIGDFAIRAGM